MKIDKKGSIFGENFKDPIFLCPAVNNEGNKTSRDNRIAQ